MFRAGAVGLLLILAASPLPTAAAGFAKQSLFLSKSSVAEGDTVLIHAVVSGDSAGDFSGTLAFADGSSPIGSVPVSLKAGESSVVSVSWKPAAGSHSVSAELRDAGGSVVETQSETFAVAPAPAPAGSSASAAASIESSQAFQQNLAQVSPTVEQYLAPAFSAVDSARNAAADALDGQITKTQAKLGAAPNIGQVLAAETTKNATQDPLGAVLYMFQVLYFYLLTLLRFIVGSVAVFYPVLALGFLYFLWHMFKRFRRPAY